MLALTLARIAPLLLIAVRPVPTSFAPPQGGGYHIVLSRPSVGAGQEVELRLVPEPPPGMRISWGFAPHGLSRDGAVPLVDYRIGGITIHSATAGHPGDGPTFVFHAPYVIAPGTPPMRASAGIAPVESPRTVTSVSADLALLPGTLAGAEDCLGPGQTFEYHVGGANPSYVAVDELPELLSRPEPLQAHGQVVRGITDTLIVVALVCRTGRVLDARVLDLRRGEDGPERIAQDPTLVRMALTTVRNYVFSPARSGGQAVAVSVAVPVAFR